MKSFIRKGWESGQVSLLCEQGDTASLMQRTRNQAWPVPSESELQHHKLQSNRRHLLAAKVTAAAVQICRCAPSTDKFTVEKTKKTVELYSRSKNGS